MKSIEKQFADWHNDAFLYGYGTGEHHTIPALKGFFSAMAAKDYAVAGHRYDYRDIELAIGAQVAWLLINILCANRIIEYGTSPRYGWLTSQGERLKDFVDRHTADQLIEIALDDDGTYCYKDACNCGPKGYQEGKECENVFWR